MAQQGLEGLKELNKAMKKLDGKVSSSIGRKSVGKAGRVVRDEIKSRTPVDTGNLRNSIRSKVKKLGRTGFAASIGPGKVMGRDRDTKKSFIKADGWYAHIIERGSRSHKIPRRGTKPLKIGGNLVMGPVEHPGTAPRPFIRPAWVAVQDRLPGVIGRELWHHINKEQKKR